MKSNKCSECGKNPKVAEQEKDSKALAERLSSKPYP